MSAFDEVNKEAKDYATFYDADGNEYDTIVNIKIEEGDSISFSFDDNNGSNVAISVPVERIKRLLKLKG